MKVHLRREESQLQLIWRNKWSWKNEKKTAPSSWYKLRNWHIQKEKTQPYYHLIWRAGWSMSYADLCQEFLSSPKIKIWPPEKFSLCSVKVFTIWGERMFSEQFKNAQPFPILSFIARQLKRSEQAANKSKSNTRNLCTFGLVNHSHQNMTCKDVEIRQFSLRFLFLLSVTVGDVSACNKVNTWYLFTCIVGTLHL